MIAPLWWKAFRESRLLLAASTALLFAFSWIFVWVSNLVDRKPLRALLDALPDVIQRLSDIPFEDVATQKGVLSLLYVDPIILITFAIWSISRGTDVVSGEIGRGTMEILLAQPISRLSVFMTQTIVTLTGAAIMTGAVFLGNYMGTLTVNLSEPVDMQEFVPAALNLFSLAICFIGISTLISSLDRYRARSVGLAGGFVLGQFIIKVLSRLVPKTHILSNLSYFTVFGVFEPQVLIKETEKAWELSMRYDGILLVLGLGSLIAGGVIFCKRDVPPPL